MRCQGKQARPTEVRVRGCRPRADRPGHVHWGVHPIWQTFKYFTQEPSFCCQIILSRCNTCSRSQSFLTFASRKDCQCQNATRGKLTKPTTPKSQRKVAPSIVVGNSAATSIIIIMTKEAAALYNKIQQTNTLCALSQTMTEPAFNSIN